MGDETTPREALATLPAGRAFVVHFRAAGGRRRWCVGRVEHLASGTSGQFASLRTLLAFFVALLEAPPEVHTQRRGPRTSPDRPNDGSTVS